MATIPSKPTVDMTDWITGQTRLNRTNLVNGINTNLQSLKTAADGTIDALIEEDAAIATKQPLLVSGTNIKTVNGQTILGAGDISFDAATSADIDELFAVYPQKGDSITLKVLQPDVTSSYMHFRVMKVEDRKIATVLQYGSAISSFSPDDTRWYARGSLVNVQVPGLSGEIMQYAGSDADIALNETLYNQFDDNLKNAIVETDISQDVWDSIIRDSGWSRYYQQGTSTSYPAETLFSANKSVHIGNRKVYAVSLSEIIEYLGVEPEQTVQASDIYRLIGDGSGSAARCLRSAIVFNTGAHFYFLTNFGYLTHDSQYWLAMNIHPMFRVDLSKVDFTIN